MGFAKDSLQTHVVQVLSLAYQVDYDNAEMLACAQ